MRIWKLYEFILSQEFQNILSGSKRKLYALFFTYGLIKGYKSGIKSHERGELVTDIRQRQFKQFEWLDLPEVKDGKKLIVFVHACNIRLLARAIKYCQTLRAHFGSKVTIVMVTCDNDEIEKRSLLKIEVKKEVINFVIISPKCDGMEDMKELIDYTIQKFISLPQTT